MPQQSKSLKYACLPGGDVVQEVSLGTIRVQYIYHFMYTYGTVVAGRLPLQKSKERGVREPLPTRSAGSLVLVYACT